MTFKEEMKIQIAERDSLKSIPEPAKGAIRFLIEHLWDESLQHFVDSAAEGVEAVSDGHVFAVLCELRSSIEGRKYDPRFYLARASDLKPTTSETTFVVDRVRNVGFEVQSQAYAGEVLQTSVGRLRDETGNVIGLDVMHACVNADGEEFCIDSSVIY
jgi:hypothetical protein